MLYQDLSKFKVPQNFRGKPEWYVQLWWTTQALLFKPSPQIFYSWRRFLLRLFGAKIGRNCVIRPSVHITYPWNLTIEDNAWVGDDVVLYSLDSIFIGENAVISQKSYLCGGGHHYDKLNFEIFKKPIVIEEQAWIATDVYIGPGVTIGKGAVVGARSSVYKSLEGGNIYTGNPAKFVKLRKE